jgi:hypothetical protein
MVPKSGCQAVAASRSAAQRLHRPVKIRDPVDVVLAAGPIQAQEPRAARLAFRARSRSLTAADVDHARTEERSLLRAWCMRKTVHLIATEDAGWLLPLFSPSIVRWSQKRLADFGLDRNGQEKALAVLHRAVEREGALTRPQLAERLEAAGFATANEFKVHLWLLATLDGALCLGPDRGGRTCLVRTEEWIGKPTTRPRDESLAELARRYLRGYGPADERDLARWAGLPLRDARLGFERIAGDSKPASRRPRGPVVRMLGAFDNYNLGYVDRGFALAPEHEKRVNPGGGIVRPAIVVDGQFIATWSSKRSGKRLSVTVEPFEPLAPEIEKAIATEVADLGRFEGVTATIPRP